MQSSTAENACVFFGKVHSLAKYIPKKRKTKKAVGPHTFSGAEVLHLREIK